MSLYKIKDYKKLLLDWSLDSLLLSFIINISILQIFTQWKLNWYSVGSAILLSLIATLICFVSKLKFKDLTLILAVQAFLNISFYLKNLDPGFWEKNRFLTVLLGTPTSASYLDFLGLPLLVLVTGYTLAKLLIRIDWTLFISKFRFKINISWTLINIILSISLSGYFALIAVLRHFSFFQSVYDFGIFDQMLYMLSRFSYPPFSTTRQFTNLFLDHQHFSLILLSPLYWLGAGFNGFSLTFITPFLLITFPSSLLNKAFNLFTNHFYPKLTFNKHNWIVLVSSVLLFIHPYTQSSIAFGFHEKYLMPVFFALTIFGLVKLAINQSWRSFILPIFGLVAWILTKEDQWLFSLVFVIQVFVWGYILKFPQSVKKWLLKFEIVGFALSLIYPAIFLRWLSQYSNSYSKIYNQNLMAFKDFILDHHSFYILVNDLKLFDGVQKYLYQTFIGFDLVGFFVLPFNVLGNYAERYLADDYSFRNPIFHYGVDVPIYTVSGILIIFILIYKYFSATFAKIYLASTIIISILSFGMVSGWNNITYLIPELPTAWSEYQNRSELRKDFYDIKSIVPDTASIVITDKFATHVTNRKYATQWPEVLILPEGTPGKNDLRKFEFWLLYKAESSTENTRNDLLSKNYKVVAENNNFVLIQNTSGELLRD